MNILETTIKARELFSGFELCRLQEEETRKLQERRIFPAIDIEKSGTRREDLLLGPDLMPRVWLMRRMYMQMISTPPNGAGMDNAVATEAIIQRMAKAKDNLTFLENLTEGN